MEIVVVIKDLSNNSEKNMILFSKNRDIT